MRRDLKDILVWTSTNVPYYQSYFQSMGKKPEELELDDFQLVIKDMYIKNHEQFQAEGLDKQSLKYASTSGTTMMPLKVVKTQMDYYTQLKNMWSYRTSEYGIKTSTKNLNLYFFNERPETSYISGNGITLNINTSKMDIDWFLSNVDFIEDFKPEYVMAYTGSFMRLLAFYEKCSRRLPKSIRNIEFIGEPLMNYQLQVVNSFTDAQVILNYSSTEVLGIAISCKQRHMHCIDKNVVVEIMKNGSTCGYGQEGDIVLTSIFSKAMPFIRYKIGDIGVLRNGNECSCGNTNDIIEITKGRSIDFIELYNGERIHSIVLCNIIEDISFILKNCVFRFQIKQTSVYQIDIYLSFRGGLDFLLPAFRKQFSKKVKNVINADILWGFHVIPILEPLEQAKIIHFQKEKS